VIRGTATPVKRVTEKVIGKENSLGRGLPAPFLGGHYQLTGDWKEQGKKLGYSDGHWRSIVNETGLRETVGKKPKGGAKKVLGTNRALKRSLTRGGGARDHQEGIKMVKEKSHLPKGCAGLDKPQTWRGHVFALWGRKAQKKNWKNQKCRVLLPSQDVFLWGGLKVKQGWKFERAARGGIRLGHK